MLLFLFLIFLLWLWLQYRSGIFESMINVSRKSIPNKIWTFWDGPRDEFVDRCIESWKLHHPAHDVVVLTKDSLRNYIPDVNVGDLRHANDNIKRYSDFVRLLVLERYGGIWTDASVICNKPFPLVSKGIQLSGYYIELFTTNDASPVIENWCFACPANSLFVKMWCNEFMRTNTFSTIKEYIEDVKRSGVSLQNIDDPEYLAMHVAAQVVLRHTGTSHLSLKSAENTAFCYLAEHNWNLLESLEDFESKKYASEPILKFREPERDVIKKQNLEISTFF